MKSIEELTHSEIINLTYEERQKMLDLECAKHGLRFAVNPGQPPEAPKITPDTDVWQVGSYTFSDYATAEKVQKVLLDAMNSRVKLTYDYGVCGGDFKYLSQLDSYERAEVNISPMRVLSNAKYQEEKARLSNYSEEKKKYEEMKKSWDTFQKERERISGWIMDKFSDAQCLESKLSSIFYNYKRYLDLADQNKEIAMNFLRNSHGVEFNDQPTRELIEIMICNFHLGIEGT